VFIFLVGHLLLEADHSFFSQRPEWHGKQIVVVSHWDFVFFHFFKLAFFTRLLLLVTDDTFLLVFVLDVGIHNLFELVHRFEPNLATLKHDLLALDFIDRYSPCNDCLNELDFVEQNLVVPLQFSQTVLFSIVVESSPQLEKLFNDIYFALVLSNLAF